MEKSIYELKIRDRLSGLRSHLEATNKARRASKAEIAKWRGWKEKYNPDTAADLIAEADQNIADLEARAKGARQAQYEKAAALLEELGNILEEKQSQPLDLASPELANTLKLIELSGRGMDADTVKKIVSPFSGDQNALRALQTVLKSQGVIFDGGIGDGGRPGSGMLYEPAAVLDNLRQFSYYVFMQGGSVNELAGPLSRWAVKENIDFPATVDELGIVDAARASAGLPEAEGKG